MTNPSIFEISQAHYQLKILNNMHWPQL